jgi:CspA family cold shock protein
MIYERDVTMPTGRVKWFNNAKGYGFILPDEGDEDLFVHYSSILMDGYKTLKAGQLVTYEILKGPKGSHAIDIHALDEADDSEESADGSQESADGSQESADGSEESADDADSASESEESVSEVSPEFVSETGSN